MTPELVAGVGFILISDAALFYMLHRAYKTIEAQADTLDVYRHALDDERKAHRSTHARLIQAQRMHKEECL